MSLQILRLTRYALSQIIVMLLIRLNLAIGVDHANFCLADRYGISI